MLPSSLIARALSRLLSHDDTARKLLGAHAGETLQVRMPPLSTTLKITTDGTFEAGASSLSEKDLTVSVEFPLSASQLAYWNIATHGWTVEPEPVRLEIGASSADIRLSRVIRVQ